MEMTPLEVIADFLKHDIDPEIIDAGADAYAAKLLARLGDTLQPSDLRHRLRERAATARSEETATALGDALHFEEAADEIEILLAARIDAHEEAEHFLSVAIDRSPEPLRQLGEYLAEVLDEDQFPRADRLLLGIATALMQGSVS
jgi:hypothetical protein